MFYESSSKLDPRILLKSRYLNGNREQGFWKTIPFLIDFFNPSRYLQCLKSFFRKHPGWSIGMLSPNYKVISLLPGFRYSFEVKCYVGLVKYAFAKNHQVHVIAIHSFPKNNEVIADIEVANPVIRNRNSTLSKLLLKFVPLRTAF